MMRSRWLCWLKVVGPMLLVSLSGCEPDDELINPRRDGGTRADGAVVRDTGVVQGPCIDLDGDGIADNLEVGDFDMDGMPDSMDQDSDGDGYPDSDEACGAYPTVMPRPPALMCGRNPVDCDSDGRPNFRDLDSDNDGLTDAEERMANTNPCAEDSDMDGVPDLTEIVAMSDPANPASMPPAGSLYVTLPYHPPMEMARHETRRFSFQTRLRAADVMFVVDTTGSMRATITNVQQTLMSRIIPGIVSAIGPMGNLRYGVAGHGDFGVGGSNYTGNVQVFQRLTRDPAAVQAATASLRADNGGDEPESMVPAMHALINGAGFPQYGGTATRNVDPIRDCGMGPDDPEMFGWACFQAGRVPIMVLMSDAAWHNGPGGGNDYGGAIPTYMALRDDMVRRGAYFIGIDVGRGVTFANSQTLARDTMTLDGMGQPLAFRGQAGAVADQVIQAVTTIAGQSRQDITTRTDPDRMEMRLMAPHTTRDFIKAVVPFGAMPEAPNGYTRKDMTTFYSVSPDAIVEFEVDFYNDFQPGAATAQLFRATIVVLGRAMAEVDRRTVYIIVPSSNAQPPIG
jgi:hypothetical protein